MKEQGMETLTLERVGELAEMLYKAQEALPVFSTGLDAAINETLTALDAAATTIAAMRAENERLREVLRRLVEHRDAMAGPRAHSLSCDCGGSNDGVHSCHSLQQAFHQARALTDTEGSD